MPHRSPSPPAANATLLRAGRHVLAPDVWRIDGAAGINGAADGSVAPRVWKTFRARPWWLRATMGRWMVAREARTLARLEGLDGVPHLIGTPEPATLEMTWLEAEPVPEVKHHPAIDTRYFAELQRLVAALHGRGVNHGDLRRKNLMRHPVTGSPQLVDFTQSMAIDRAPGRWLRTTLIRVDDTRLLKMKRWYLGDEALTPDERATLDAQPWWIRAGHGLRKGLYRPLRRLMMGRKNR